ncbi:hypothetical protein PROFUN_07535 [Planoprotostelium fungivorum]|uniref:Guanylate kinase-like domain-containing protein n=1 Tax=Planoprotostelium fungivorum TaxID=1890364 RepID=A0A2P6NLP4_9EUKA|nr:hypothetical protein PROFUN_07535 [Planoprotostelium fungivorum]
MNLREQCSQRREGDDCSAPKGNISCAISLLQGSFPPGACVNHNTNSISRFVEGTLLVSNILSLISDTSLESWLIRDCFNGFGWLVRGSHLRHHINPEPAGMIDPHNLFKDSDAPARLSEAETIQTICQQFHTNRENLPTSWSSSCDILLSIVSIGFIGFRADNRQVLYLSFKLGTERSQGTPISFHSNELSARKHAVELAIHGSYNTVENSGYFSFSAAGEEERGFGKQQPRIYVDDRSDPYINSIQSSLLLPRTSIGHISGKMTVERLQEVVEQDKEGKECKPLYVSSQYEEDIHEILQLSDYCKANLLWLSLYVEGPHILAAIDHVDLVDVADLLVLNVGAFIGAPQISVYATVLLKNRKAPRVEHLEGGKNVGTLNRVKGVSLIPTWAFLSTLGSDHATKRVTATTEAIASISTALAGIDGLKIVHHSMTSLSFQSNLEGYANALNQHILKKAIRLSSLGVISKEGYLKISPLTSGSSLPSPTDVTDFIDMLKRELPLANKTIENCGEFETSSKRYPGLSVVKCSTLTPALLGGVTYIPSYLAGEDLGAELRAELESLNIELANQLMKRREVYTRATTEDGRPCVGVSVDETTAERGSIDSLVDEIHQTATKLDLSEKMMSRIAEVVQRGIKMAQEQLQNQEADALYQEVGSVYNWWNPFSKPEQQGRSFHLGSQALKTTKSIKLTSSTPNLLTLRDEKGRANISSSASAIPPVKTTDDLVISEVTEPVKEKVSVVVVVGPSGVGKGTRVYALSHSFSSTYAASVINRLMSEFPDKLGFSVSHTTRQPRSGEREGVDYHFTTVEVIQKEIESGQFVEHANVHGNYYGTSKVRRGLKGDTDLSSLLWNNKVTVDLRKSLNPTVKHSGIESHYIFIAPPSREILESRLRGRGTETEEAIQKRLAGSVKEMQFLETSPTFFDAVIVNDKLDEAYLQFKAEIL